MAKTVQDIVAAYQTGVASAGTKYQTGVERTDKDWAGTLVSSQDVMVQHYQESVASGRFGRRVQALGTQGWKSRTVAKAGNYAASSQRAAQGYAQQAQNVLAASQAGQAAAGNLPRGTFEQNMQRSIASNRAIMEHWRNLRG